MSTLGSNRTLAGTGEQIITKAGSRSVTDATNLTSKAIPVRVPAISTSWEELTDTGLVGVAFCVVELPDGGYRAYYMGKGGIVSALSTDGLEFTREGMVMAGEEEDLAPVGGTVFLSVPTGVG